MNNDATIHDYLKKYFGFDTFKGTQEQIIKNILSGRDTFVLMPTGGGKSLCYQLPAVIKSGTAIVISPLIALMKNQVDAMRNFSTDDEVAHFLNSSLTKTESTRVKNDVLSGIRRVGDLLKQNRLFFSETCKDCLREFSLYCWNEKSGVDVPIKENDHAMDDVRYFVSVVMSNDGNPQDGFFVASLPR